jgi:hypothetical protein
MLLCKQVELNSRHEDLACAFFVCGDCLSELTDPQLKAHAQRTAQTMKLCTMGALRGSCVSLPVDGIDGEGELIRTARKRSSPWNVHLHVCSVRDRPTKW